MPAIERTFITLLCLGVVALLFLGVTANITGVSESTAAMSRFCLWFSIIVIPASLVALLLNRLVMKLTQWRFRHWDTRKLREREEMRERDQLPR